MFMDSDTLIWIKERIKNPVRKKLFVFAFKTLTIVARLRWKYKYFDFPLDYLLFSYAKSQNKSI